jgi:hypothetical protein
MKTISEMINFLENADILEFRILHRSPAYV